MSHRFILAALAGLAALTGFPSGALGDSSAEIPEAALEFGPLAHRFRLTLEPGDREEWLGPLYAAEATENGSSHLSLAPPLFVREINPSLELDRFDVLYPLVTWSRHGSEYRFQLLQLLAWSGGQTPGDEEEKKRLTLFPFFFSQRSTANPSNNYTALVPFYGTMKNHLFRDEVRFVLMPLYVQSRKGGVITDNYLAPFIHRRYGTGHDGWQVWPLVGHETKGITYKTNNLDEAVLVPGHEKTFALWPIWHRQRLGLGGANPQTNTLLFPLIVHQRSPNRDQSQYLFPLVTYIHDRGRQYREWGFPWPLVGFARGEGKTANRIWPFYSHGSSASAESDFILWPLYMHKGVRSEAYTRDRSRVLFFLWSDTREKNIVGKTERRRRDLWPLFTHKKDYSGNERLQVLAPLEPLVPNNRGIERGWSPVWSIYRSENNPKAGIRSQSLLWNLWRREVSTNGTRSSFLFGAVKTDTSHSGRDWSFFRRKVRAKRSGEN